MSWVVHSPLLLSCLQNVTRLEFCLGFECWFVAWLGMVTSRVELQAVLGPCLTRKTSSAFYAAFSMTRNCRPRPLYYINSYCLGARRRWGEIVAPVRCKFLCSMRIDSLNYDSTVTVRIQGNWWCIPRRPKAFICMWICETWFARQSDPSVCRNKACGVRRVN